MSHRTSITIAAGPGHRLAGRRPGAGAVDYPPPAYPKGGTAKPKGPFQTLKVCKAKSVLPDHPVGRQQGQAG